MLSAAYMESPTFWQAFRAPYLHQHKRLIPLKHARLDACIVHRLCANSQNPINCMLLASPLATITGTLGHSVLSSLPRLRAGLGSFFLWPLKDSRRQSFIKLSNIAKLFGLVVCNNRKKALCRRNGKTLLKVVPSSLGQLGVKFASWSYRQVIFVTFQGVSNEPGVVSEKALNSLFTRFAFISLTIATYALNSCKLCWVTVRALWMR